MSLQCVVIDRSGMTTRPQLNDKSKRVAPRDKALLNKSEVLQSRRIFLVQRNVY